MNETKPGVLTLPVAIIVAGALIAVSVIYTNTPHTAKVVNNTEKIVEVLPIDETDRILGNPNAPIVIVEYSDTECPFCKNFHSTMHRLIEKYGKEGKVAWVYRHMPITNLHPKAWNEAIATECAGASFWKYIDRVYEITPSNNGLETSKLDDIAKEFGVKDFRTCLDQKKTEAKVQRDYDNGVAINGGRPGTPTSVLVLKDTLSTDKKTALQTIVRNEGLDAYITTADDGRSVMIKGAFPYEVMALMIDLISQN